MINWCDAINLLRSTIQALSPKKYPYGHDSHQGNKQFPPHHVPCPASPPNAHQLINHSFPLRHHSQYLRDGHGVECSFPVTADPPNGALGEPRFHPNPAKVALHETAQVQCGDKVRTAFAAESTPVLLSVLCIHNEWWALFGRLQSPPDHEPPTTEDFDEQRWILVDDLWQQLSHPRSFRDVALHRNGRDNGGNAGQRH